MRSLPLPASVPSALALFAFPENGGACGLTPIRAPWAEAWEAAGTVTRLEQDGVLIRDDGRFAFLELRMDGEDIENDAHAAYLKLGDALTSISAMHPLRIWNHFDRLNRGDGDAERYRRFCVGRHRAIAEPDFESRLPAATVIGGQAPGLWLGCLAARAPGIPVENPRQLSAFLYPREYGPVSPSFSRATLVDRTLLVSGTAAVVGHSTQHPQDAHAQFEETAINLRVLLAHARRQHFPAEPDAEWTPQALRLYLRDPACFEALMPRVLAEFGEEVPINVLRGDISRRDLLLEMEGVWTL